VVNTHCPSLLSPPHLRFCLRPRHHVLATRGHLAKIIHSRVIRRYCHRETITLSNCTYAVYDEPQARSAGTWFLYIALADPRAEPPTHVSEYIERSEYTLVGSICDDGAPHFLDSHCSPTLGGLSTGIFRRAPYVLNETKRPSPCRFGKRPNILLKTATEHAAADQLNAAGYAFLQEQSELAGLLGIPYTAE